MGGGARRGRACMHVPRRPLNLFIVPRRARAGQSVFDVLDGTNAQFTHPGSGTDLAIPGEEVLMGHDRRETHGAAGMQLLR